MMDPSILGIIIGIKLSVFVIALVYILLADISLKTKGVHWLNITTIAFILISLFELFQALGSGQQSASIEPWLLTNQGLNIFAVTLYTVAGLGIILFLNHVNNNLAKYR